MHKVIKYDGDNSISNIVRIPDMPFLEKVENEPFFDDSEEGKLSAELYDEVIDNAQKEIDKLKSRMLEVTAKERQRLIIDAQNEAERIISKAKAEAEAIVNQANDEYDGICRKAYEEGYNDGTQKKSKDVENLIDEIREKLDDMSNLHVHYMEEYASELKWLALEAAEKLIIKKIDEDDLILMDLIRDVMKSIRDTKWVTVEISDELNRLAKAIVNEMNTADTKLEVNQLKDVHKGTCMIQMADRIIDASILTQLSNMEDFFNEKDEAGYAIQN